MAKSSGSIRRDDPYPRPNQPQLRLVKSDTSPEQTVNVGDVSISLMGSIDHIDGSTTYEFGSGDAQTRLPKHDPSHDENLAEFMDEGDLGQLASDLLDGVKRDELSRAEWLETRALGIQLLALKLEKPRTDLGGSSAPLEGMSTVRHPLLLEATVSFQATARAELLPSAGPVKVRNDSPILPRSVISSPNPEDPDNPYPSLPPASATANSDERAQALEQDLNHYILTCTDYVADTDRMLFYVGFGGDGFKKVFHCPLRRRPVSESVSAEDFIVSNAAVDLRNCGRKTHRIKMRKSVLKRMQIEGRYRDVDLAPPMQASTNPVDEQKAQIGGYNTTNQKPEDRDYEIYEIYCELDLDEFAPKRFKNKGLPLPYCVTVEKESRQILDIRRNWKEKDKECKEREVFVQFPMVRGLGFYGLGYIHLLGNTTMALTAAWRLQLDNGMFANFPGFLYSKGIGRQLTNQFRVPPGGGVGLEIGSQASIKDSVMPLPYKETGPSFANFTTHVEEVGRRLAQTANINVGEGKQDAPVGTTLALIEQATKLMDSAHKRLHAAQGRELELIVELLREDPEAFFRCCKTKTKWEKKQFLEALEDYHIVPVSDPNNPTSLHRMAKAMAIQQLAKESPDLYDLVAVNLRVMQTADIDPSGLFRKTPATPAPDPRMEAIQQKADSVNQQNQIQLMEAQLKAQTEASQIQDNAAERQSRSQIEDKKIQLELLKIKQDQIIHTQQMANDSAAAQQKMQLDQAAHEHKLKMDAHAKMTDVLHTHAQNQLSQAAEHFKQGGEIQMQQKQNEAQLQMEAQKHRAEMAKQAQAHQQEMEQSREKHAVELEMAKKMAAETAKAAGPSEKREGEAHKQDMKIKGEKHKVDLTNSKKLTEAKVKSMTSKSKSDKQAKAKKD